MQTGIEIRLLDRQQDRAHVAKVFERCTDYVLLETGEPPSSDNVVEYFSDVPTGVPLDRAMKLGVELAGELVGVMDVVRGYPEASDWYIGLLMLDPAVRNKGVGADVLTRIVKAALAEDVQRILLCVLKENLRGRAFWHREGFTFRQEAPPWTAGRITHRRFELMREINAK